MGGEKLSHGLDPEVEKCFRKSTMEDSIMASSIGSTAVKAPM